MGRWLRIGTVHWDSSSRSGKKSATGRKCGWKPWRPAERWANCGRPWPRWTPCGPASTRPTATISTAAWRLTRSAPCAWSPTTPPSPSGSKRPPSNTTSRRKSKPCPVVLENKQTNQQTSFIDLFNVQYCALNAKRLLKMRTIFYSMTSKCFSDETLPNTLEPRKINDRRRNRVQC